MAHNDDLCINIVENEYVGTYVLPIFAWMSFPSIVLLINEWIKWFVSLQLKMECLISNVFRLHLQICCKGGSFNCLQAE